MNTEDDISRQFQNFKDLTIVQANLSASLSKSHKDRDNDDKDFIAMLSVSSLSTSNSLQNKPNFQNNPILDPGASRHMFNNLAHFTHYEQNSNPSITVELAEGSTIPIVGRGNVGSLTNVLYLKCVLFGNVKDNVFDVNNKLFLSGKNHNGLYRVWF